MELYFLIFGWVGFVAVVVTGYIDFLRFQRYLKDASAEVDEERRRHADAVDALLKCQHQVRQQQAKNQRQRNELHRLHLTLEEHRDALKTERRQSPYTGFMEISARPGRADNYQVMSIDLRKTSACAWEFRVLDDDGNVLAVGPQTYFNRESAELACTAFVLSAAGATWCVAGC